MAYKGSEMLRHFLCVRVGAGCGRGCGLGSGCGGWGIGGCGLRSVRGWRCHLLREIELDG